MRRDEFPVDVQKRLAQRVGYRCSLCGIDTVGPSNETPRSTNNIGMASHITGAAPGGPRHDPEITADERRSIENGIWTCRNCGTLIDNDTTRYSTEHLRELKRQAELRAVEQLGSQNRSSGARLTVGEVLVVLGFNICLPVVTALGGGDGPSVLAAGCLGIVVLAVLLRRRDIAYLGFLSGLWLGAARAKAAPLSAVAGPMPLGSAVGIAGGLLASLVACAYGAWHLIDPLDFEEQTGHYRLNLGQSDIEPVSPLLEPRPPPEPQKRSGPFKVEPVTPPSSIVRNLDCSGNGFYEADRFCIRCGSAGETKAMLSDGNPCTKDECDARLGVLHRLLDGVVCDDGDRSTVADRCNRGVCSGLLTPDPTTDSAVSDSPICPTAWAKPRRLELDAVVRAKVEALRERSHGKRSNQVVLTGHSSAYRFGDGMSGFFLKNEANLLRPGYYEYHIDLAFTVTCSTPTRSNSPFDFELAVGFADAIATWRVRAGIEDARSADFKNSVTDDGIVRITEGLGPGDINGSIKPYQHWCYRSGIFDNDTDKDLIQFDSVSIALKPICVDHVR